jgi:3-(3-hydroxy-phenyl)propionate hydroxylase
VEVLVAGLGPVGSVAALRLAQQGITVAAIEADPIGASDLRASTFHAATLEMLDEIDAARSLLEQGLKAPIYQFRDRQTDEVFSFDLGELEGIVRYPFRIQCEQHKMAQAVAKRIKQEGKAQTAYDTRLLYFEQDDDGVTAYVETPLAVEKYRAKFLIAADGGSSTARKLLDIGFAGHTYTERFVCYSTDYPVEKAFRDLCYVNYISDPVRWLVILRVPGLWRILLPAAEVLDDETALSDEYVAGVFRDVLKNDDPVTTHHRTVYKVHQRVAETFAKNRVALVGDAAHLNSPVGGFGMNSGIHDAFNVVDKIIRILRGGETLDLMALYDRQRRTVTHDFIQAQTISNMEAMRSGWANVREKRREAMRRRMEDDETRRAFLLEQSMITSVQQANAIK